MGRKQVIIIRSPLSDLRHVLVEKRSETDSHLLTRLNKGIINRRTQSSLCTKKDRLFFLCNGQRLYRPFGCQIIYCIISILSVNKELTPKLMKIIEDGLH